MAAAKTVGRRAGAAFLLLGACALAQGCITDERVADQWVAERSAKEASAPLGGEALVQRKLDLDRSYRNLGHFLTTLDGLSRRKDRDGIVMFAEFVDFYVAKNVVPLLEPEWQSRHPEVSGLDVNARFAVAAIWSKIGSDSSSNRMLDEIERRYKGRDDMLVGYPFGTETTLAQALKHLREHGA